MIFPPTLERGDTVLLVSPSSPLTEKQPIEDVARAVEDMGYRVRIGDSCREKTACGYAAASPETRAVGEKVIAANIPDVTNPKARQVLIDRLEKITQGERDFRF